MERLIRDEALWLLRSMGAGALLALLYDLEQTLCAPLHRILRKLWDILFLLGATLWLFGLSLRSHGEVRLSFFLALGLGALCYGLSIRKKVKGLLRRVEKTEGIIADKGNELWKKIQFYVKKCFSKWKNSYTIRTEAARAKRKGYGESREREKPAEARLAAESFDGLTLRTTYSAERVGREDGGGTAPHATGEQRGSAEREERAPAKKHRGERAGN